MDTSASAACWSKVQKSISQLRLKAETGEASTKCHFLPILSSAEDLLAAFTEFGRWHAKEVRASQSRQKSLQRDIARLSEHLRDVAGRQEYAFLLPKLEDVGSRSRGETIDDTTFKNANCQLRASNISKPRILCKEEKQTKAEVALSTQAHDLGSTLHIQKGRPDGDLSSNVFRCLQDPVVKKEEGAMGIGLGTFPRASGARLTRAEARRKLVSQQQQPLKWYENPVITKKLESMPRKKIFFTNLSRAEGISCNE